MFLPFYLLLAYTGSVRLACLVDVHSTLHFPSVLRLRPVGHLSAAAKSLRLARSRPGLRVGTRYPCWNPTKLSSLLAWPSQLAGTRDTTSAYVPGTNDEQVLLAPSSVITCGQSLRPRRDARGTGRAGARFNILISLDLRSLRPMDMCCQAIPGGVFERQASLPQRASCVDRASGAGAPLWGAAHRSGAERPHLNFLGNDPLQD